MCSISSRSLASQAHLDPGCRRRGIVRNGFAGTRIEDVADRGGVTKGTVSALNQGESCSKP